MDSNQRQFITIVVVIAFITSAVAGFVAGGIGASFLTKLRPASIADQTNQSVSLSDTTPQEEHIVRVVKDASPAVVSIIISKDLSLVQQYNPFGDFFGNLFGLPQPTPTPNSGSQKTEIGGGTGFIVDPNGLILTNKHVVQDTQADYTVLTNDGQKYPAKVLALDPVQDLAIIKIDKNNLPTLKFGDSDKIEIGQTIIVIGNALGEFRNTVSVGVISGLQRSITASDSFGTAAEQLDNVIQTDAAINPGNSGGPLLNINGEVIGINVAMAQGAQNIAFALPINKAKRDIDQVQKQGKITTPFLGIRYTIITPQLQQQNNLSVDYGALIAGGQTQSEPAITPGSPAASAGLVENDIILEADGQKITTDNPLSQIIQNHNVGDTITLKVLHNGQEKTINVVLGER
jgi:S1-C subfamily serine protease